MIMAMAMLVWLGVGAENWVMGGIVTCVELGVCGCSDGGSGWGGNEDGWGGWLDICGGAEMKML